MTLQTMEPQSAVALDPHANPLVDARAQLIDLEPCSGGLW